MQLFMWAQLRAVMVAFEVAIFAVLQSITATQLLLLARLYSYRPTPYSHPVRGVQRQLQGGWECVSHLPGGDGWRILLPLFPSSTCAMGRIKQSRHYITLHFCQKITALTFMVFMVSKVTMTPKRQSSIYILLGLQLQPLI